MFFFFLGLIPVCVMRQKARKDWDALFIIWKNGQAKFMWLLLKHFAHINVKPSSLLRAHFWLFIFFIVILWFIIIFKLPEKFIVKRQAIEPVVTSASGPLVTKGTDVSWGLEGARFQFKLFHFSNHSEIWQAILQQRCRDACQIAERYGHNNVQSRRFGASWDLLVRRLIA